MKTKYTSYTIDVDIKTDWQDILRQLHAIREFPCTLEMPNRVMHFLEAREFHAFKDGFEVGVDVILDKWEAKGPRPAAPIKSAQVTDFGVPAKNTVMALIYSGAQNPEKYLTLEESLHIEELVAQLSEVSQDKEPSSFATGGFYVHLQDRNGKLLALRAYPMGSVFVWYNEKEEWIPFVDSSGICGYLMKLMAPVIYKHNAEARQAMHAQFDTAQNMG